MLFHEVPAVELLLLHGKTGGQRKPRRLPGGWREILAVAAKPVMQILRAAARGIRDAAGEGDFIARFEIMRRVARGLAEIADVIVVEFPDYGRLQCDPCLRAVAVFLDGKSVIAE